MTDPSARVHETPLWIAISEALAELVEVDAIGLQAPRERVIDAICERIINAHVLTQSATQSAETIRLRLASFLERAAETNPEGLDWHEAVATHYADPAVEGVRQQAALTAFRLHRGDITEAQAAEYFRKLARRLRGGGT
jgi:hypothetical protein